MKPTKINTITNIFLIIGCLALTLDFVLAINLGLHLGFSTSVNGWTRYGRHPIWEELIVITLLFSTLLTTFLTFNSKPNKQAKLLKYLGTNNEKLLQVINPYFMAFFDLFVFYKILIMYLLGRY